MIDNVMRIVFRDFFVNFFSQVVKENQSARVCLFRRKEFFWAIFFSEKNFSQFFCLEDLERDKAT